MASKRGIELFVGRLSAYITNQELRELFTPFGVVKAARLIRDPKTRKPKGFGFVEFESEGDAQKALKVMNGRIVNGRLIFVEVAETDKAGNHHCCLTMDPSIHDPDFYSIPPHARKCEEARKMSTNISNFLFYDYFNQNSCSN